MVYATILPFNNIGEALLEELYHYDTRTADSYLSIPYTLSAIASPFLGALIDLIGIRAILLTFSAASLSFAHAIFAFMTLHPVLPLVIIGSSYRYDSSSSSL